MDTLIIGGGMAGCAAAITAARAGQSVLILERSQKPLRKLCASGNGRGNLLNLGQLRYYGDAAIWKSVFDCVTPAQVEDFWRSVGVPLAMEADNRVYPSIRLAQAACDALLLACKQHNIQIICDSEVTDILPQGDGSFQIVSRETLRRPMAGKQGAKGKTEIIGMSEKTYCARRVILAAGGSAAPSLGTDGGAYALLKKLGHIITLLRPALCPIQTVSALPQTLCGQRLRASVMLADKADQPLSPAFSGEILFAADGVSGIAAMQLARFLPDGSGAVLHIDAREALGFEGQSEKDIARVLIDTAKSLGALPASYLLTGRLVSPAALVLLAYAQIGAGTPCHSLTGEQLRRLGRLIGDWTLKISGSRGFDQAQVTAGGLLASQLDVNTLESKKVKGLYVAGEALDVDGDCGGFNLMFAAASGILCGRGGAI